MSARMAMSIVVRRLLLPRLSSAVLLLKQYAPRCCRCATQRSMLICFSDAVHGRIRSHAARAAASAAVHAPPPTAYARHECDAMPQARCRRAAPSSESESTGI